MISQQSFPFKFLRKYNIEKYIFFMEPEFHFSPEGRLRVAQVGWLRLACLFWWARDVASPLRCILQRGPTPSLKVHAAAFDLRMT